MSHLISIPEAAHRLGVSTRTLDRMGERGEIMFVRVGRLKRVRSDVVDAIVEGRSTSSPPPQVARTRDTHGRYE